MRFPAGDIEIRRPRDRVAKSHVYGEDQERSRVTVEPRYLEDRSDPSERRFFWAYTIEIANAGAAPVQILARHWIITDQNGRREDVRGIGVVGEQPVIEPGGSFTYTSGCPLPRLRARWWAPTRRSTTTARSSPSPYRPSRSIFPAQKRVLN